MPVAFRLSLPSLSRRANGALVGIDLSNSSVKVVELSQGQKTPLRLERYAIEALEPGAVVEGNIERSEVVVEALNRALRRSGSKAKEAALALPSAAVISKKITLPGGLREEDYEIQVEAEASNYIPFPIEEVNLDFQILGPAAGGEGEVDVLLAASRREKVDDRVAIAEMAGLKPVVMDAEPYSMRAAVDRFTYQLPEHAQDRIIAVFTIGQLLTSLTVVLNGQTIFEREQQLGGQQLTMEIARLYGLDPLEAESRKRSGELPENYASELLKPFIDQCAADLARALQPFYSSTAYSHVDMVLLGGGASAMPGLADAVSARLNVPTEVLNPFAGMELGAGVRERQLQLDAPSLVVAAGLAMRSFDA